MLFYSLTMLLNPWCSKISGQCWWMRVRGLCEQEEDSWWIKSTLWTTFIFLNPNPPTLEQSEAEDVQYFQAAVPTLVARPHCRTQDSSHLFTFLIQLFINSYNLILNMDIFPLRVIEHEDGTNRHLRPTIMLPFKASSIGFHANPGTPSWSASRNPLEWPTPG